MRQQRLDQQRFLTVLAAVGLIAGFPGGVALGEEAPQAAVQAEVVATESVKLADRDAKISAAAFEWVDISIHMPDGRVIHSKERRYPSRSRVYQLTGRLPMIKRGGAGSSGPAQDGGGNLMTVIVDGEEGGAGGVIGDGEIVDASGIEGSESLVDDVVVAAEAGSTSGPVAVNDSGGGAVVEQSSGRAVRVFKKSS